MCDSADCVIGKKPEVFGDNIRSVSGLFLNLDNPAQCNGYVTSWNICYYVFEGEQNTIEVGVWRNNSENENFDLVSKSMLRIQLSSSASIEFICQQWEVSSHIMVRTGDVVGVYYAPDESLTYIAVGNAGDSTIYQRVGALDFNQSFNSSFLTQKAGYGLYIEANITTGM